MKDRKRMVKRADPERKDNVLRATLNWFNDFFGTGLEELDQGETGKPASCVIAMTLNNRINPNFNWRVSGTEISISSEQPFNSEGWRMRDTFNEKYQQWGVPVTIGEGLVYNVNTKESHPITAGVDYHTSNAEQKVTDLPEEVKQFILWFDSGNYDDLAIHHGDDECACKDCAEFDDSRVDLDNHIGFSQV